MNAITTTYSSAAPYIRESIMRAASGRINAKTQKRRREYTGELFGLVHALKILLRSPEGVDSPAGYPEFYGGNEQLVLADIERFVGGPKQMLELGFVATAREEA
jgi:hypothetical protein